MTTKSDNFPPGDIQELLKEISSRLVDREETIAVSEAACGGLISAYLVSVPGASRYYQGGTLLYSLKSRLKLSGWNEKDIESYTGPSQAVVKRLARNLKIEFGSTYSVSESGYAGPTGGPHSKDDNGSGSGDLDPAGTLYIAVIGPKGEFATKINTGISDRGENMKLFAREALEFLLEVMKKDGETEEMNEK